VDRDDERQKAMETGCWGGQGSPRAVVPRGRKELPGRDVTMQNTHLENILYIYAMMVQSSAIQTLFCGTLGLRRSWGYVRTFPL
jgi:hypothetical protein